MPSGNSEMRLFSSCSITRADNFVASASCRYDSPFSSRAWRRRAAGSSVRCPATTSTDGRWLFARTAYLSRGQELILGISPRRVKGKTHVDDSFLHKLNGRLPYCRDEGTHRG